MLNYLLDLLLHAVVLMILDLPFLTYILGSYGPMINAVTGKPMAVPRNLRTFISVALAYTAMSLGLREVARDDWTAVILGLAIYGTYSFTNMVLFEEWNPWVAITETLWGGILYFLARRAVPVVRTLIGL